LLKNIKFELDTDQKINFVELKYLCKFKMFI